MARIGDFPADLDSNACERNDGAMMIKYYYHVIKPWLQTINVSVSSEMKTLLIFDDCLSHLNIDLLKEMGGGGGGMVVLLRMTNTSHETNVEDLVTFGITKT